MGRDRISRGERIRFTLEAVEAVEAVEGSIPLRIAGGRLGNLAPFPRPWTLKAPIRQQVRVWTFRIARPKLTCRHEMNSQQDWSSYTVAHMQVGRPLR
jgi:hypothetical protein